MMMGLAVEGDLLDLAGEMFSAIYDIFECLKIIDFCAENDSFCYFRGFQGNYFKTFLHTIRSGIIPSTTSSA